MHTMKLMQQTRQATPLFWAAILAFYPAPSRADDWASAPPMPTPRFSLAATASPDGQTIYALGGARAIGFSRGFDVVEAYDTSTQTWSSLQEMLFQRFGLAAATASAGRVYPVGGA